MSRYGSWESIATHGSEICFGGVFGGGFITIGTFSHMAGVKRGVLGRE